MIKEYFSHYTGRKHYLLWNGAKPYNRTISKNWYNKAKRIAQKKHTHVFYCLEQLTDNGYGTCQYFTIPIDNYDLELLPYLINPNPENDYYIGIAYSKDVPPISTKDMASIRQQYSHIINSKVPTLNSINGYEFEQLCASYLARIDFDNIDITPKSGDQGIDIIAHKDGYSYGIQCKFYQKSVSNRAVQEAFSGAKYYGCDIPVVLTNSVYTKSAKELATTIGVELWHIDLSEVG